MSGTEYQVSHFLVKAVGISRAVSILETHQEVTLSAINSAISTAVHIAEFIKHRVKNLYQVNKFERVEESKNTRLSIHLSLKPLKVDEKGYQAPLSEAEVTEKSFSDLKKLPWENLDGEKPQETPGQNWGNRDENRSTNGRRGRGRGTWNRTSRFRRGRRDYRGAEEPREINNNEERTESTQRPHKAGGESDNRHADQEEHAFGDNQTRSRRSRRGRRGDFGRGRGEFGRGRGEFGRGRGEFGRGRGEFGRGRGDFGRGRGDFEQDRGDFEQDRGDFGPRRGDFGPRRGDFGPRRGARRGRNPRFGGISENEPSQETKQYTELSRGSNRGHRRPRGPRAGLE